MGGSCQMAARCHDGSNQRQPLLPTTRGWKRNHGMVVTSPTIRPTRDGRRAGQGRSLQWPPPKSPRFPHPCLARPAWQQACYLIQPAGRDQGSCEIPPPDSYISEDLIDSGLEGYSPKLNTSYLWLYSFAFFAPPYPQSPPNTPDLNVPSQPQQVESEGS